MLLQDMDSLGRVPIPRVGALLDVQPIADIVGVEGQDTFRARQIYAGIDLFRIRE